jgi:hypothetical protein
LVSLWQTNSVGLKLERLFALEVIRPENVVIGEGIIPPGST